MEEFDLLYYVRVVVKRKTLVLRVCAGAFLVSCLVSLALPKMYTATARLLPPPPDSAGASKFLMMSKLDLQGLGGGAPQVGIQPDLYGGMLRSSTVEEAVIRRFNLREVYRKKYLSDTVKTLDRRLKVTVDKKSGIITFTVDDRDPGRAAGIANAFLDELEKVTVDMKAATAAKERCFLERRLAEARVDLAASEEKLKRFQKANKTLQVEGQADAAIRGIAELKSQLALQEVRLAALRSFQTEASPEVEIAKAGVVKLRSQLSHMEGENGPGAIPTFGSALSLDQEYTRIMREREVQEGIVNFLTRLCENAYLNETRDVPDIRVLDRAEVPDKRSRPKRIRIVVLSTVSAMVCSVLLALLLEHFERMPAERKEGWRLVCEGITAKRLCKKKEP